MGNIYDSFSLEKYHKNIDKMKLKSLNSAIESTNSINKIIGNIGLAGISLGLRNHHEKPIIAGSTLAAIQSNSYFAKFQNELSFNSIPKVGTFAIFDMVDIRTHGETMNSIFKQNKLLGVHSKDFLLGKNIWSNYQSQMNTIANSIVGTYELQNGIDKFSSLFERVDYSLGFLKNVGTSHLSEATSILYDSGVINKPLNITNKSQDEDYISNIFNLEDDDININRVNILAENTDVFLNSIMKFTNNNIETIRTIIGILEIIIFIYNLTVAKPTEINNITHEHYYNTEENKTFYSSVFQTDCNIYMNPSNESRIITTIKDNTKYKILQVKENWSLIEFKIDDNKIKGWINNDIRLMDHSNDILDS